MELTKELTELLLENGAKLVGIGDMSDVPGCEYAVGVSIAIPVPKEITHDLQKAPTKEYYDTYYELNDRLNHIVALGEDFLIKKGFSAYAQTTDRVSEDENMETHIPHKTVATRAGLGWIGKNCLLVTEAYGSAIRISSLLTDAPLVCNESVEESLCGNCRLCIDNCPAFALYGATWKNGMSRHDILDVMKCFETQEEIMRRETGIDQDLCGKCFAVCKYTQRYLAGYKHIKHEFDPIYDQNSRILILGTLPSVKSRENNFYYGHKQNRFWNVLARIYKEDTPLEIEEKRAFLLRNHIAVWDVISECDIIGSSDSSIRNVVPTDINGLLEKTNIKEIYANGATSYNLYMKYTFPKTGKAITKLPSTSPANAAFSLERLLTIWSEKLK